MTFLFRKFGPFFDWVELVRAGSPASDPYDAQRRLEILKQNSFLNELRPQIDGFISQTDKEIENLSFDLSIVLLFLFKSFEAFLIVIFPSETLAIISTLSWV